MSRTYIPQAVDERPAVPSNVWTAGCSRLSHRSARACRWTAAQNCRYNSPLTPPEPDPMPDPTLAPVAVLTDLLALTPVRCRCGWARRAFGEVPGAPVSVHRVEIEADARTHYHREHTEVYYV